MKLEYTKPVAEKVEFTYREHIVASGQCDWNDMFMEELTCKIDFHSPNFS